MGHCEDERAELRLLIDEIEQFLAEQLVRIESQIHQPQTEQRIAADLERAEALLREEQQAWTADRQNELARLKQEAELLRGGWEQLEAEQRRLLAEREMLRRGVAPAANAMNSAESAADAASQMLPPDDEVTREHSAWVQFQRMRRQMQHHLQPQ